MPYSGRALLPRKGAKFSRHFYASIILALLVVAAFPILRVTSASTTLTVCPSDCSYKRIQDALNNANPGDTVHVLSSYTSVGETFPIVWTPGSVTLTGDTDSNGNPITVIDLVVGTPTSDCINQFGVSGTCFYGIVIYSDNDIVENLKFIDSNTGTSNDVHAVINGATNLPPPHDQYRGTGLQIINVNVDLRGGAGGAFHGILGFQLFENNLLINGAKIYGVNLWGISIDGGGINGGTSTIENSMIDGRNNGSPVTQIGVAFGKDVPAPGCSGPGPNDYAITDNTLIGFTAGTPHTSNGDGLNSCNPSRLTITGNTITDAGGTAIDLANVQTGTISGNTINWINVGGSTGIGISPGSAVTISYNILTGRISPTKDVGKGIVLGTCVNCKVQGNILKNFHGSDALTLQMPAGTSTNSLIDFNTVTNNDGNGISYLGSDQSGTAVDQTVVSNNNSTKNGQNGIIFVNVAGTGNAVSNNVVRSSNQGNLANTHGFNLQGLMGTSINSNQAYDTGGNGAGFFIANSQSLTGGCNTGSNNGGGLLQQVNVIPTFQNSCTPTGFDFRLYNSGSSSNLGGIAVARGSSGSITITAVLVNGPAQTVTLHCSQANGSPLPSGVSCGTVSGTPPFATALTVTVSSSTAPGYYTIKVTGTAGGLTRITLFTLRVT